MTYPLLKHSPGGYLVCHSRCSDADTRARCPLGNERNARAKDKKNIRMIKAYNRKHGLKGF